MAALPNGRPPVRDGPGSSTLSPPPSLRRLPCPCNFWTHEVRSSLAFFIRSPFYPSSNYAGPASLQKNCRAKGLPCKKPIFADLSPPARPFFPSRVPHPVVGVDLEECGVSRSLKTVRFMFFPLGFCWPFFFIRGHGVTPQGSLLPRLLNPDIISLTGV